MDVLLPTLLLLVSVSPVLSNIESERFKFDRSASKISKFLTTKDSVYHMEMDQYAAGNMLFSDGHSLKTTDGQTTQTIVGDAFYNGYAEGVGAAARFWYITGFAQISKERVVVVDWGNRCLRLIDRLTKQTQVFSGTCTVMGNRDGLQALFIKPWSVIIDSQNKGKLLVTEYKAVRHVGIKTGHATTIFRDNKLDYVGGITQDVGTGDLYLTSQSAVFKLRYQNKALSHVAGTSMLKGHMDGILSAAKFNAPVELLLIDRGTKLILADNSNHRLRVLDKESNATQSLCTGIRAHNAANMDSCSLYDPFSLMVSGDALFIGEYQQISKIVGQTLPSTAPTTKYTIPQTTTTNSPIATSLCAHGNITQKLRPGEKMVDVEIEHGLKMSFPAGEYHFKIATAHESCMIHVSVTEAKPNSNHKCQAHMNSIASSTTGLAHFEFTCGESSHSMNLPVGQYNYQTSIKGENCSTLVKIADSHIVRRLNIKAYYKIECSLLTDPITKSSVTSAADSHFLQIDGPLICDNDCRRLQGTDPVISCANDMLTIMWPTNQKYRGDVTKVPAGVYSRLSKRLRRAGPVLNMFIVSLTPPVVLPQKTEVVLVNDCSDNKLYLSDTDTCE